MSYEEDDAEGCPGDCESVGRDEDDKEWELLDFLDYYGHKERNAMWNEEKRYETFHGRMLYTRWARCDLEIEAFEEALKQKLPDGTLIYGGRRAANNGAKWQYYAVMVFQNRKHWSQAETKMYVEDTMEASSVLLDVPGHSEKLVEFLSRRQKTVSLCGETFGERIGSLYDTKVCIAFQSKKLTDTSCESRCRTQFLFHIDTTSGGTMLIS
jgi:hypothetical protein